MMSGLTETLRTFDGLYDAVMEPQAEKKQSLRIAELIERLRITDR